MPTQGPISSTTVPAVGREFREISCIRAGRRRAGVLVVGTEQVRIVGLTRQEVVEAAVRTGRRLDVLKSRLMVMVEGQRRRHTDRDAG